MNGTSSQPTKSVIFISIHLLIIPSIEEKFFSSGNRKTSNDGLEIILEERKASNPEDEDIKSFPTMQNIKLTRESYEIVDSPTPKSNRIRSQISHSFYQPSPSIYTTFFPELKEDNIQRTRSYTLSKLQSQSEKEISSESGSEFSLNLSGGALSGEDSTVEQKIPESDLSEDSDFSRARATAIDKTNQKGRLNVPRYDDEEFEQKVACSLPRENSLLRKTTLNLLTREEPSKSLSSRPSERTLSAAPQDFNKLFGNMSSSMLLLKQGPVSPKPATQQKPQSNPLRQCCRYDYKIVSKEDNEELSNGMKPLVNPTDVRIERMAILDDAKVLKFVAKLEQEGMERSISDRTKLEERCSDEPYIVYKKGDSSFAASPFTTNIQAIDLDKLLNLICEYKISRNPKMSKDADERKQKLLKIFLLSHDLFCSSVELLIELIKRFFLPLPDNTSKSEMKAYEIYFRTPSQYTMLNVIATWIELRGRDFYENKYLSKLLEIFVKYGCGGNTLIQVSESIQKGLHLLLYYKTFCCNSLSKASNQEAMKLN